MPGPAGCSSWAFIGLLFFVVFLFLFFFGVLDRSLQSLAATIKEVLVEIKPGIEDAIVGQPIGFGGLLVELKAEMVPYTPEEIISIGEEEFSWCIAEFEKASRSMGCGDDWKKAL